MIQPKNLNRRNFLEAAGLAAAATLVSPDKVLAKSKSAKKPNVVFVLTDDQGYGDLACHGNEVIKTPNLDKMHAESTRFTNFHVSPCCSPSRAQLMSGRYSSRVGVWHTVCGRSLMHKDEVTMADIFRANGYKTAMFGKWHLGDNYPYRPQDRGFEEVLIHGGGGVGNLPDVWANNYIDDTYYHNGKKEKYKGYCTDVWFDEALKFIDKNKDTPFFCYISTNAPHLPFVVPGEYDQMYDKPNLTESMGKFYGMITNIDDNMKKLRDHLKNLKLEDNTILIFMTDTGSSRGYADPPGKYKFNAGMRGGKGTQYEGGHRVPFFIYYPDGDLNKGRDIDTLTAGFDLTPTLIELCGIKRPAGPKLDGKSLVPLLKGQTDSWRQRTLVVDNQRITHPQRWRCTAVMTDRWRLIDGKELYDVKEDPVQKSNIFDDNPDIVKKLTAVYDKWWADISKSYDKDYEITIGADEENPAMLTAHDYLGAAVWNHDQILSAKRADGYWAVHVAKEGTYEFTVRRWPKEVNAPITAAIDTPEKLKTLIYYSPGLDYAINHDKARPITATYARLKIRDMDIEEPLNDETVEVAFKVKLKPGPAKLQAWFVDGRDDGNATGVYYCYAKRI